MATGFRHTSDSSLPAPASASVPLPASLAAAPLVRLLARLSGPDAPPAADLPFAEQVGKWLHWTDAAALHEALDGASPPVKARPAGVDAATLAQAVARSRETIARAIEADCAAIERDADDDDHRAWRRVVVNRLQSMQLTLAPLREGLRSALAARSPSGARLAQVDAVMERALGAQERALLGALLPSVLHRHADRLRTGAATRDAWRPLFCRELRAVLTAALDLCLQPLDGLLAALNAAPPMDA